MWSLERKQCLALVSFTEVYAMSSCGITGLKKISLDTTSSISLVDSCRNHSRCEKGIKLDAACVIFYASLDTTSSISLVDSCRNHSRCEKGIKLDAACVIFYALSYSNRTQVIQ